MRLDIYLPWHRKKHKDYVPPKPGRLGRFFRLFLPRSWFSNPDSGKKGRVRMALKKVGTTWMYSPWRRVIQGLCLLAFLLFFCWMIWPYGAEGNYAEHRESREVVDGEFFLIIDPLVALSTAIASHSWVWSLTAAGIILLVCIFIPRGFCGYICPLGTVIDLFDWAIGKRFKKTKLKDNVDRGWWIHLKYYILAACLIAAMFGILLTGFVAAIPVVTRAALFILKPFELGFEKGVYLIPAWNWGHILSLVLFFGILGMGLLRRRFWCSYLCPSGAVFSLGNLFRSTERKVETSCINCNRCVEVCPFDAIKADFTTRTADCTLCQTCGGVCPTHAIKFVGRWEFDKLKKENDPETNEIPPSRRGFLAASLAGVGAVFGIDKLVGADIENTPAKELPVRPPGSVPEQEFLQKCIRCGECFQACPNDVLQPMGFKQGLEGLWTPEVVANWAGCEPSCNNCGQVCPTGAIRALPLAEKKVARMGMAFVNEDTCLPYAGEEACDLCVQECNAAGYFAIEYLGVHTEVDEEGYPIPDSGFSAPVVLADKCVGCGLCQTRCHNVLVKTRGVLKETAIWVEAGAGREDRMTHGSYLQLREEEKKRKEWGQQKSKGEDDYMPDFLEDD